MVLEHFSDGALAGFEMVAIDSFGVVEAVVRDETSSWSDCDFIWVAKRLMRQEQKTAILLLFGSFLEEGAHVDIFLWDGIDLRFIGEPQSV